MPDGFLNLLKPPGMSSFLAVHLVRKLLPKGTKVGHMGTLDPAAAGVGRIAYAENGSYSKYIGYARCCP